MSAENESKKLLVTAIKGVLLKNHIECTGKAKNNIIEKFIEEMSAPKSSVKNALAAYKDAVNPPLSKPTKVIKNTELEKMKELYAVQLAFNKRLMNLISEST